MRAWGWWGGRSHALGLGGAQPPAAPGLATRAPPPLTHTRPRPSREAFNQASLYSAYEKRTANIKPDAAEYQAAKSSDPEFYRAADSLLYGSSVHKPSEANVERMVAELNDRQARGKGFSRRRKHSDDKDVDYINDRNAHFNKKVLWRARERGRDLPLGAHHAAQTTHTRARPVTPTPLSPHLPSDRARVWQVYC